MLSGNISLTEKIESPVLGWQIESSRDGALLRTSADEAWSVILSGRNLTDEEYLVTGVYGTAFQVYEGVFDRGSQWQLELRKRFQ